MGKACKDLCNKVTDPKLRKCIKSRCDSKNAIITCKDTAKCRSSLTTLAYYWRRESAEGFNYCPNHPKLSSLYGPAAIHEWAHSCGWEHRDGKGVPYSK